MTPTRKPPHCRTCHKPLKGHKRGVCDTTDDATFTPTHSEGTTHKVASPPLERLPTLSTESSQILNDILRVDSHIAPSLQVPEVNRTGPRRSARAKRDEPPREALGSSKADDEEQKPGEITPSNHDEFLTMPGTWEEKSDQSHTGATIQSSPCVISQQLVVKASGKESSLDSPTISVSRQLKLEDTTPGESCSHQEKLLASEVPPADPIIQNFLDSMAKNLGHSPATIFSYPIDGMASLEDKVKSHGLCMHILSLPKPKPEWTPVIIGRDMNAIIKLLEDGNKLAEGLRRPKTFKVHGITLGMSHVIVGTLGALATWAGLAYT